MFGTGSRTHSSSPKPQAGWASSATSAWWHGYFLSRAGSAKPSIWHFLWGGSRLLWMITWLIPTLHRLKSSPKENWGVLNTTGSASFPHNGQN